MLLGNSCNEQLENGSSGLNVEGGGGGGGEVGEGGIQLKKGPWTAAEDAILTDYVRKHGEGNWNAVQRNTGLARCGKSCRLRWANHLRPNLKKGAFSPEEERLIVELHAQLGNKWARMAAQLPGRTDNEIKNYWNTRVKRRHRQGLPLYPPEIQPQHKHQHQQSHHHSYHSQPSTPTTPNVSFSFQTTATTPTTPTAHNHPHYPPPYYSRSPSPLTPTPPPLSPTLHSPSFPTLSLFDHSTAATNNLNNNGSSSNVNSAFNFPRTPPLLQSPLRFKRFHSDSFLNTTVTSTGIGHGIVTNSNSNTNNNNLGCNNNYTSNISNSGTFSIPFSTPFLRSSPSSPLSSPQTNGNTFSASTSKLSSLPSFNFSTPPSSSSMFRNPVDKDYIFSNGSVFSLKPELPSNQLLSQNGNTHEVNFDNEKLSVSSSGSGLLEDLLEEAQAMAGGNYGESSKRLCSMSSMEGQNKREFSGFNQWSDSSSLNLSAGGLKPKEETGGGQLSNMHEDLSKLLNVIPSMQVPEWYGDSGEASNCQSSVVTDDNIGLEMQQIASLLRADPTTAIVNVPGSCSFDNLPGIC